MLLSAYPVDKTVSFTFHTDPGHGWLEVTRDIALSVGLRPGDFSKYSYQANGGETLYLEEDCDLARFLVAYTAKHGSVPSMVDKHSNGESFIRRLPRCISYSNR